MVAVAILDLTPFDFGRFLVCYSPHEIVPEAVKNPFLAIVGGMVVIFEYTVFHNIKTPLFFANNFSKYRQILTKIVSLCLLENIPACQKNPHVSFLNIFCKA